VPMPSGRVLRPRKKWQKVVLGKLEA
jgi:hypothetical protein